MTGLGSLLLLSILAASERPNVLFVVVDDMRVELGCYGQSHVQSPHLDALAGRAMRFDRAYCQQAVCNPSRASALTGLRPYTLGLHDLATHFRQRRPGIVTLPQAMMLAGYHTRCIGKVFHNWLHPKQRGDSRSWSVPSIMHYAHHGDDVPHVGLLPPNTSPTPKTQRRDVPDEAYFDGRIATLAADSLRAYAAAEEQQPFFLAVGFWKPHAPFNAPARYWDLYDRDAIDPPTPAKPPRNVPPLAMHDGRELRSGFRDRPGRRPNDADTLALRHGYYAAISYVDAQIGRVLTALRESGLGENTVVVFWSDHGYHLGEKTLWAKTSNFELDARVPLLIATPPSLDLPRDGRSTDSLVELLDLYPTLCDLTGVEPPHRLEGTSLVPLLDGREPPPRYALTEHPRPAYISDETPATAMGLSLRAPRYRYTEWRRVDDGTTTDDILATELYDHERDPDETANIAAEQPDAVATMQATLRSLLAE